MTNSVRACAWCGWVVVLGMGTFEGSSTDTNVKGSIGKGVSAS